MEAGTTIAAVTPFLAVLLMFAGPIIGGVVLGLVQLAGYRLLGQTAERTPSFPLLFARGVLACFVIAAAMAIVTGMASR